MNIFILFIIIIFLFNSCDVIIIIKIIFFNVNLNRVFKRYSYDFNYFLFIELDKLINI